MSAIKTIWVGTDNTEKSLAALHYAAAMAARTGLPLTALHAYLYPPDHYYLPDMIFANLRLEDSTVRKDALDALEHHLERADLQEIGREVEPGAAHTALLQRAGESSLLVVGHSHRKASARALAGSVATRVVRGAAGPVIVVPPDEASLPRKVLIADDFSEPAKSIASTLSALRLTENASLHVVYCLEDAMEPYMHALESVDDEIPKRWQALERGFSEMLVERYASLRDSVGLCSTQVLRGEFAADAVLAHVEREKFDLIAVASHGKGAIKRTLLGSTTEALIHQAKVPVLVTH